MLYSFLGVNVQSLGLLKKAAQFTEFRNDALAILMTGSKVPIAVLPTLIVSVGFTEDY